MVSAFGAHFELASLNLSRKVLLGGVGGINTVSAATRDSHGQTETVVGRFFLEWVSFVYQIEIALMLYSTLFRISCVTL